MFKLKSTYNISFSCSTEEAENIVLAWLVENKFKRLNKYEEDAYYQHQFFKSDKGFQYNIYGNIVKADAWIVGQDKGFYPIESPSIKAIDSNQYKKILDNLINRLN